MGHIETAAALNVAGRRSYVPSRRYLYLASAAAIALAPASALAGNLTVSTARNTAAATSTGDGQGPGNITIESTGSITLAVPNGANVVIDTSNTVTNGGSISNTAEQNASGVLIQLTDPTSGGGRHLISGLTNNLVINVSGPAEGSALLNQPVNNAGVRVEGVGLFQGNIRNSTGSSIAVGGVGSAGININGVVGGAIENAGAISVTSNGSYGILTTKYVSNDISNTGSIAGPGLLTTGMYVGGGLGGKIYQGGSITTGRNSFFNIDGTLNPVQSGGPAIWVASNIGGGLLFEGNQVTDAKESTVGVPEGAPADSFMAAIGGGDTVVIRPGGPAGLNDIFVGRLAGDANGDSLVSRGNISSTSSTTGAAVRAILITGDAAEGGTRNIDLLGGIRNANGDIVAQSTDAQVQGMLIGNAATVPSFFNAGDMLVRSLDSKADAATGAAGDGGGNAYGIVITNGGTLGAFANTGNFRAEARGKAFNAYGIVDNSGTMISFINTGTFETVLAFDGTGRTIAADLSANTTGIDFQNSGVIRGDFMFGAGNDAFNTHSGTIDGDLSFGAGNETVTVRNTLLIGNMDLGIGSHVVRVENGSTMQGGISLGAGGTADLFVDNSTIVVPDAKPLTVTNADISGNSTLNFTINGQNGQVGALRADGTVNLGANANLKTTINGIIANQVTVNVIESGNLVLGTSIDDLEVVSPSYMFSQDYHLAADNPNILQLDVKRRTAQDLGLGDNMGAVYEASVSALDTDAAVITTLAALETEETFETALQQLMPDASDGSIVAAVNSQSLAYGAIRRRLTGIPRIAGSAPGTEHSSFWLQQYGSYSNRSAVAEQPGYTMYALGIAAGMDRQFTDTIKLGTSISQTWSLPDDKKTNDRPLVISSTQLDFYGRHQVGGSFAQAIVGGAYNTYKSDRRVEIGELERQAEGKWKGHQFGGAIDTGQELAIGNGYRMTTYMRGSVLRTHEGSYTETGGGDGVNLDYESRNLSSLRAGVGATLFKGYQVLQDTRFEGELRADYMREFSNDPVTVRAKFAAGDVSFVNEGMKPGANILGVGFSMGIKDIFSALTLDYDASLSSGFINHTAAVTFRFRL